MNGWHNHATWMVALHIQNDGEESVEVLRGRLSKERTYDDGQILKDFVHDIIAAENRGEDMPPGSLMQDIILSTLKDVCWYEIYDMVSEMLGENEEEGETE
jgi:hypothetical protein